MTTTLKAIQDKLNFLEVEMVSLREGYVAVNKRYTDALTGLTSMTINASDAAQRAAKAAKLASKAATDSARAAKQAASEFVVAAAESAAQAAEYAAEAALALLVLTPTVAVDALSQSAAVTDCFSVSVTPGKMSLKVLLARL